METAFERLGPHLLRMSDGETGERAEWVGSQIEWMRVNPDVDRLTELPVKDYDSGNAFKVKDGRDLQADNIRLGYYVAFHESYPAFKFLREKYEQPQVSFQVGVPAPMDFAADLFGWEAHQANPGIAEAFRAATVKEIERIHAEAGDDVIFQIETVVGLVAITMTPEEHQQATAEQIASELKKLVADCPNGTRFGAHLCLGDFHHKAFGKLVDATPVVLLANALSKDFPKSQKLEYIHVPFAAADEPGSMEESWYEPLQGLKVPDDVRFAAGFIHEDVSAKDNKKLLEMIERLAGREVDVAAACGLGRRPDPAQAWDAMDKAVALLEN